MFVYWEAVLELGASYLTKWTQDTNWQERIVIFTPACNNGRNLTYTTAYTFGSNEEVIAETRRKVNPSHKEGIKMLKDSDNIVCLINSHECIHVITLHVACAYININTKSVFEWQINCFMSYCIYS